MKNAIIALLVFVMFYIQMMRCFRKKVFTCFNCVKVFSEEKMSVLLCGTDGDGNQYGITLCRECLYSRRLHKNQIIFEVQRQHHFTEKEITEIAYAIDEHEYERQARLN